MSTQVMTERQRKVELSKAMSLYRTAAKQATTALGNRHKEIGEKVLDQISDIRGRIDTLISAGDYAPSVAYRIKQLQAQQRSQAEGFAAAIKQGELKAARTVLRFLLSTDAELSELCGIDVE